MPTRPTVSFLPKIANFQRRDDGFGMTKRAGRSATMTPDLWKCSTHKQARCALLPKSWDYHVDVALGIAMMKILASIRDSVAAVGQHGREAIIDCEHFFDGYKANRDYALACATAALEAGARWVVLCDTNGGTLPDEVFEIVSDVAQHIPGDHLGIHTHNDTENAVANTLAAVQAGVRQLQGTINGLGERCGNANLVSLIPTLLLKPRYADSFETGIDIENLPALRAVSNLLDELLNQTPNRHARLMSAHRLLPIRWHSCLGSDERPDHLRACRA
ncbi:MAG: hypothetical protein CM15mP21_1700 [Hyphomicrobiales bacterium]|nr:MAG: hypothetical protein CM15mP21_1700 [Hyphomicrobiales bacterium]